MTVMIGVDPHKRSHTAVALNDDGDVLGQLRVEADRDQVTRLLKFAKRWPRRTWAIENANGLGRLLSRQLVAAGETVVDVPARLSAQVRTLSGSGHKTDAHDARSTAVAGRHARALRPVILDDHTVVIGLLLERRWQLVSQRQKTLCRIHDQLVALTPGGAKKYLSAYSAANQLRGIRPDDDTGRLRKTIAKQLVAELRVLDRKIKAVNAELDDAIDQHGTTLTLIDGIGRVGAATIISIVGDITRFHSSAAFATFNGTAPVAASSGDKVRHRINHGGQRQLNKVLHTAAKTQRRMPGHQGHDYIERRMAEGKSAAEATRALRRHLSNVVFRTMLADHVETQVSGEDIRAA